MRSQLLCSSTFRHPTQTFIFVDIEKVFVHSSSIFLLAGDINEPWIFYSLEIPEQNTIIFFQTLWNFVEYVLNETFAFLQVSSSWRFKNFSLSIPANNSIKTFSGKRWYLWVRKLGRDLDPMYQYCVKKTRTNRQKILTTQQHETKEISLPYQQLVLVLNTNAGVSVCQLIRLLILSPQCVEQWQNIFFQWDLLFNRHYWLKLRIWFVSWLF